MRSAWLEIDLGNLAHNLKQLQQASGQLSFIGVVKANAYGHGAVAIGRELLRLGAWGLAVATVQEGLELRQAGLEGRILLLGSLHPAEAAEALQAGLIASLSTPEAAQALNQAAAKLGQAAPVHLEVDTGMHRTGFPWSQAAQWKERLAGWPNLALSGVYSHFASADEDPAFTQLQTERFLAVQQVFGPQVMYHLGNSPGALGFNQSTLQAIRPGIALYGLMEGYNLRPLARLLAKPTLVKPVEANEPIGYGGTYRTPQRQWVATLPIGYADGLPRALSNQGRVWLGHLPCPILGRVSMDQITVGLPHQVSLDTVFTVITPNFDPHSSLAAWARMSHTIPYEMAVRLSPRLPRLYLGGEVAQ